MNGTTKEKRAKVDAAALTGCAKSKSWIETWAAKDRARAEALQMHTVRLLDELWPVEGDMPLDSHVSAASVDMGKIPAALLDGLSGTLVKRARHLRTSDLAASFAHELIACWLICRRLAVKKGSLQRADAAELGAEYERFVRKLIQTGCPVAA